MSTCLVHKVSISMPQSARFIAQLNPSVEQKLSPPFPCKPRLVFPSIMSFQAVSV
ncbi:unnamed protein product [Hymenolepis diminuta]|uniref:Uncharacterized protein n=1 Tax=Hymenolepis diminuta TaxID=6216 RepID=A0A564Y048_HYMDI|nr:unnamed protein product [Hymenolepis diminuta]